MCLFSVCKSAVVCAQVQSDFILLVYCTACSDVSSCHRTQAGCGIMSPCSMHCFEQDVLRRCDKHRQGKVRSVCSDCCMSRLCVSHLLV